MAKITSNQAWPIESLINNSRDPYPKMGRWSASLCPQRAQCLLRSTKWPPLRTREATSATTSNSQSASSRSTWRITASFPAIIVACSSWIATTSSSWRSRTSSLRSSSYRLSKSFTMNSIIWISNDRVCSKSWRRPCTRTPCPLTSSNKTRIF